MVQSQGNWLDVETIRLYDTGSNKLELTVNKITGEPCYQWNSEVWVSPSPIAQFKVLKDPIVQGKEFDVFNYSENAHRYQWFVDGFNQGQSTHLKETFNDTLIHSIALWAWNEMGCEDSLLKFYRAHFPTTIYWPNAFTPNDDELNNTWYPTGVNVLAYQITICNRWGEKVFDGQRNQPFDGTYQGRPLLEGVYVAVVEIEDVEHQHKKESRTLVLLRNK
jgi:gliding motility-associated-like protein